MIDPASVAFDIDGVYADTMHLFLNIARQVYNINSIRYEDISCYDLEDCLGIDKQIIDAIVYRILDGDFQQALKPIDGAPQVIARLAQRHAPVLFVTARPYLGTLSAWFRESLLPATDAVEIIATGSFENKAAVLRERNKSVFVEDRLETCFDLQAAGVQPVVFRQPWNRRSHSFLEVGSWHELEALFQYER
jgi:hypothetical protein